MGHGCLARTARFARDPGLAALPRPRRIPAGLPSSVPTLVLVLLYLSFFLSRHHWGGSAKLPCPHLEAATPKQEYWRRFKTVAVHKAYAPVHCVAFAPAAPFDFCTTNSTRVQIYGNKGKTLRRTISRFKDVVYTAAFRGDGKLLVAGGEEKDLKVFDTGTGGMLRMLKGHTRAVHTCHFADDKVHLMSGGDDAVVRFWDVSSVRAFA